MPTKQAKQQDSAAPVARAEQDVAQAEQHLEAAQVEVVEAHQERAEAEQQQRQAGEGAVIQEQIERLQAAAEPDAGRIGYSVTTWKALPYYRSNDGKFETFDEERMQAYVREQMV